MTPMSKELWAEVKPLLEEALDLDPDARAEWLERLRRRSPRLADEVGAMLAPPIRDPDLFSPVEAGGVLDRSLAGQLVGGYTLDHPIGRGGMGTVWLAHRSDGRFEGRAAVKLLNLALVGQAGEQRFRNEATVLARLTHPNIARLFDAGVTAGGQPFLTLEYVEGQPIDRFADERTLSTEQRIRLMIDVLTAVGSAHANLIVHRDIKPPNILVTGDGRVKLLDFGIARMLEEGRATQATLTEPGHRALTPEYGAPELVTGAPVSTATDVYSAGVLLYVLLAGAHPTSREGDTAPSAIAAVVEREPLRLSEAVEAGADRGARAALRGTSPQTLARLCRGDLDHILGKALRKEPAERYPTAMAFADDLARFLRHEPVAAVAESVGYRTRKFVRRHRAAVLATAIALFGLIGGGAFAVQQMLIARQERDRAEDARRRTEASVTFEALLFRLIQPGAPAMTYEELLEKGRIALEKEYRGEPVSRMQLGITFAQNYLRGNDPESAREIIGRTVQVADSIGESEWRGRTRCELAAVYAVMRQPDSALAAVQAGRRMVEAVRRPDEATLDACDYAEGNALFAANQRDSAAAIFRSMVGRLERAGDTTRSAYLETLSELARALNGSGKIRDARDIIFRLVRATRQGATADPRTINVLLFNVGLMFDALGEYRDQRLYLGPELARSLREDSVSVDAMNLFDYGMALREVGETDSGAYWFARAVANRSRIDSARAFVTHLFLARRALALGLVDSARHHHAMAALEQPIAARSPSARVFLAVERIRDARETGKPLAVRAAVEEEMKAMDYKPDARAQRISVLLAEAAEALIATGLYREALPYAEHLERLGTRDSLALVRSGVVGRGFLLQARVQAAIGDSGRARALVARAIAPLDFGYGAQHALTREAVALRDALVR